MSDESKGLRVRSFFDLEARTLLEKYRVIQTLLPHDSTKGSAHRAEEGRYIESLLRDFLNRHLPVNLRAVSGFVLCPSTKTGTSNRARVECFPDRHSRQMDIIVYDFASYPIYEKFEEFCIVPPEGVVGLVSVKKTLYGADIEGELTALRDTADICRADGRRGPCTSIFAFAAKHNDNNRLNDSIFDKILSVHSGRHFDPMVNEVCVLGRTVVFKFRREDSPAGKARYVGVDCIGRAHVGIQRLLNSILSVYYDPTRGSTRERPGFVSFEKATFRNSPVLGDVDYGAH